MVFSMWVLWPLFSKQGSDIMLCRSSTHIAQSTNLQPRISFLFIKAFEEEQDLHLHQHNFFTVHAIYIPTYK